MADDAFDSLCVRLKKEFYDVKHHHKYLIDIDSLDAGTCLLGPLEYPAIVANGARRYLTACEDRSVLRMIENSSKAVTSSRKVVRRAAPTTTEAPKRVLRRRSKVETTTPARPRIVRRSRG